MKFCSNCGEKVNEEAVFCPNCGTSLKPLPTQPLDSDDGGEQFAQSQEEATRSTQETLPKKKADNKLIVILASILLVAGLIAVVARFYSQGAFSTKPKVVKVAGNKKAGAKGDVFSYINGDNFGLMNDKLDIIEENASDYPVHFNEFGVASFTTDGDYWGLKNKAGETIKKPFAYSIGTNHTEPWSRVSRQSSHGVMIYEEEFGDYDEDDEWVSSYGTGLIDSEGEILYKAKPDLNFYGFHSSDKLVFTNDDYLSGVMSETGEVLIEPLYYDLSILTDKLLSVRKHEDDQFYQLINFKEEVVEDKVSESQIYSLGKNSDYFLMESRTGKRVIYDNKFDKIILETPHTLYNISEDGKYLIFANKDQKAGVMTIKGEEVIPAEYDTIRANGSFTVVLASNYDGRSYLLNMKNEVLYETKKAMEPTSSPNLFVVGDYDDKTQTIVNSQGESLIDYNEEASDLLSDSIYFTRDLGLKEVILLPAFVPLKDSPYELYNLYTNDGVELDNNIIYAAELADKVFTQDNMGTVKLIDKKNGKIIKEKQIEVDQPSPTSDSYW